jgi:hypothetical protein
MDRLLKRVRGDSPANAGTWKQPAADQAATPAPAPEAPSEASLKKEEYLPRSPAPEQTSNLSAMRELANDAARHAIERHIRKHTGKQATGKLLAAGLTVAASLVLAYWAWKGHSLRAALGALMGAGIGTYWTIGAIRRIANVMRLNRPQPQTELPVDAIMEITADSSSPAPQETHSV